jgi:hypothetical protein
MRAQGAAKTPKTPLRGATRRRIVRVGVPVTALAVIAAGGIQAATASPLTAAELSPRTVGSAPQIPSGAVPATAPNGDTKITVDVALKPRNADALQTLATAVNDPTSPDYHQFLAKGQFAASFAPAQSTIDAVDAALRSAGLAPGAVTQDGLAIPVSATVDQLKAAFGVDIAGYRLADGRSVFANTSAPKVEGAIAGDLTGIVGLDNLVAPSAQYTRVGKPVAVKSGSTSVRRLTVTGKTAPASAICSTYSAALADDGLGAPVDGGNYYSPQAIASAYGLTSAYAAGEFGNGVNVAVVEFENDSPTAISNFESCFGLDVPVSYTTVDGGPSAAPDDTQNVGVESSLDIEDLAALAPGVSITDYEGPDITPDFTDANWLDTLAAPVTADSAKVISVSWGGCEIDNDSALFPAENNVFAAAALQGQSVFSSAGDEGSTDCFGDETGHDSLVSVDDPASQPYVTGVGGTTMQGIGSPSIGVWNNTGNALAADPGAGGGGVSAFEKVDDVDGFYQNGFTGKGYTNACDASSALACRQVPDVTALADPFTGYVIGAWNPNDDNGLGGVDIFPIGGTSGAAPTWAALTAIADSSAACAANGPAGFVNPKLYDVARNATTYAANFTDVTRGNNDLPTSGYTGTDYSATTGYDLASGIGSPKGATLVKTLCEQPPQVTRLWGGIAIETATAISGYDFADNGTATDNGHDSQGRIQAQAVVLSRSDKFYDALAGSALAAQKKAPLLITPPSELNAGVQTEIARILPKGGTVYLLGGTLALSQNVQNTLQTLGYHIVRFAGGDLYDTATLVDQAISPDPSKVIVATGLQYYDALSAGAAAGANPGTVVVLTHGTTMPTISTQYLNSLSPSAAYGAGGPGNTALRNAISDKQVHWASSVTVTSLVGGIAPDTSLLIAGTFFSHPPKVALATSHGWYDALTGGAAAGLNDSPLLLTTPTALYGPDSTYIEQKVSTGLTAALILGGPQALDQNVVTGVEAAMEG